MYTVRTKYWAYFMRYDGYAAHTIEYTVCTIGYTVHTNAYNKYNSTYTVCDVTGLQGFAPQEKSRVRQFGQFEYIRIFFVMYDVISSIIKSVVEWLIQQISLGWHLSKHDIWIKLLDYLYHNTHGNPKKYRVFLYKDFSICSKDILYTLWLDHYSTLRKINRKKLNIKSFLDHVTVKLLFRIIERNSATLQRQTTSF